MRGVVTLAAFALLLLAARPPAQRAASSIAIVGDWQLDLARTRYGPGVDRRRSERFACVAAANTVRCTIRGVRTDGREVNGRFAATVDGGITTVSGLPDIDAVRLTRSGEAIVDGTFYARGTAVFGYRAMQSEDGNSLMIIPVDPVTRAVLTTVVVYDRRR